MKLSSTEISPWHKTIVYGPAKTGKTRLVGRLAEHYKLDYFDGEKSTLTLMSDANLKPEYRDNVNLISLPDDGDNGIMFTTLYKALCTPRVSICDEHGRIDCPECKKNPSATYNEFSIADKDPNRIIVTDSITQLTTSCIAYITRGKPDDYKLEYSDWGKLKNYMERMFSIIQSCPAHVVCITHEEVAEFEDGKKRIVPVAGSSKFATTTAKYFDTVVYTEQRGANFICSSGPGKVPNVLTGSRLNVKVEEINNLYTPLQQLYTKGIK